MNINMRAQQIAARLRPYSRQLQIAGSIRRGIPARDIDIVIIPEDKDKIVRTIQNMGGRIYASGDKQTFFKIDHTDVNIYYTTPSSWGAALMTRTGPREGNIGNRTLARNKGMILNQYGLFKNNTKVAGKTEKDIYEALGKTYKPPSQRGR